MLTTQEHGIEISDDLITRCMHCGLCLPTCPTFAVTGLERSSPRGRIRMVKGVLEGELALSAQFIEEMNFCLDCQACESACPAGVRYGSIVEGARSMIFERGSGSYLERVLKRFVMRPLFSSKKRLKSAARLLRKIQASSFLQRIILSGAAHTVVPRLQRLEALSPRMDRVFFDETHGEVLSPEGEIRHKVAFLSGCIMDVAFSDVHRDTVEVLLRNGCQVFIPANQECCGSLQAHNGDLRGAVALARHNIDIFENEEIEWIITNSAGCGAFMKEYFEHLTSDASYAAKARAFSAKVKDLAEVLSLIGMRKPSVPFKKRVTYHDACHLAHAQKVTVEPRAIIQSIPGVDYVELNEASWCCGSAGIYNVARYDDSMLFLDRKMENVRETDADLIVASNPGCISQIAYGLKKSKMKGEVVHLATLIKRAYAAAPED
ncbi:MAG TPA: (Fe-S)-binding protein [Bacteroidota bacterium]|nr:(Fe-S)-binding protein [Bacteroidota bacterium]